jgi:acyl carrier protein
MDRDAARKRFDDTIAEVLDIEAVAITDALSFKDDLDVDSLAFVEITLALEEAFDIDIPEPEPEQVETVGGAWTYVSGILGV